MQEVATKRGTNNAERGTWNAERKNVITFSLKTYIVKVKDYYLTTLYVKTNRDEYENLLLSRHAAP